MRILISVCVGLKLSLNKTEELLKYAGLAFVHTDKVHYAYYHLITYYNGLSVDYCNEILEKLGISEKHFLGSQERMAKTS